MLPGFKEEEDDELTIKQQEKVDDLMSQLEKRDLTYRDKKAINCIINARNKGKQHH